MVTVEQILDLLADTLINAPEVDLSMVRGNQKTIRDGLIQLGRDNSEKLILFEKDVKANEEDFLDEDTGQSLTSIVESFDEELDISQCSFAIGFDAGSPPIIQSIVLTADGDTFNMTNIFYNGEAGNPINLSQFMNLQELTQNIDIGLAEEYLDTTIFELLPDITLRQQRIINFFNEFQNLVGDAPQFNPNSDGLIDVDENSVFLNNDFYSENHDISTAQDGDPTIGIQEEDSFITRLEQDANSNNEQYTLQGLRNTLNNYLQDIDQELPPLQDERPTYRNQSSGYLKFRNLNQGIIIRNTENEFLQGLDPNNPTWLNTGFSITMWVKFLDKSSQGTLFNYGNPFRENQNEAFGFSLETYVLKRDDAVGVIGYGASTSNTWGEIFQDGNQLGLTYDNAAPNEGFFSDDNAERFIRLVVKDENKLRGSHVGMPFLDRREGLPEFNTGDLFSDPPDGFEIGDLPYEHTFGLMTNTRVPIDYSEWYFICATYNPNIQEDISHSDNGIYDVYKNDSDFWRGNLFPGGGYTHHSTYGTRCKVEIISKTDLLRARGFKVD
jgi:hypothetical protein